jgi:hypothetical protein
MILSLGIMVFLYLTNCFVPVAAGGDSFVFPYPNDVLTKNYPLGSSLIVYSSGLHYVPSADLLQFSVDEQKGDYCVINLFADNERVGGEKIKMYSQTATNAETRKKYLAITFLNPQLAEDNYKTLKGINEINRDLQKLAKAKQLKIYDNTNRYIERVSNFCRSGIKLSRMRIDGNDGKSRITFLYEIPSK